MAKIFDAFELPNKYDNQNTATPFEFRVMAGNDVEMRVVLQSLIWDYGDEIHR